MAQSILLASIVFYVKRDWIFDQILAQAAEGQSGELEIDGIELAIFKHLPNITVSLENVRYYEKKDSLRKVGELPIVYARDLYLAFEPLPFIASGILKVSNVSLEGGELNIIEYGDGKLNLELALLNPRLAGPFKAKELKTLKNIRGTRARPIEGSQPSPRVVAVDQSKSRSFEFRIISYC